MALHLAWPIHETLQESIQRLAMSVQRAVSPQECEVHHCYETQRKDDHRSTLLCCGSRILEQICQFLGRNFHTIQQISRVLIRILKRCVLRPQLRIHFVGELMHNVHTVSDFTHDLILFAHQFHLLSLLVVDDQVATQILCRIGSASHYQRLPLVLLHLLPGLRVVDRPMDIRYSRACVHDETFALIDIERRQTKSFHILFYNTNCLIQRFEVLLYCLQIIDELLSGPIELVVLSRVCALEEFLPSGEYCLSCVCGVLDLIFDHVKRVIMLVEIPHCQCLVRRSMTSGCVTWSAAA